VLAVYTDQEYNQQLYGLVGKKQQNYRGPKAEFTLVCIFIHLSNYTVAARLFLEQFITTAQYYNCSTLFENSEFNSVSLFI